MRLERIGLMGALAGVVLAGLVTGSGCDGAPDDDGVSRAGQAELRSAFPVHRLHPMHDAGSVGGIPGGATGTSGSGGSAPADGGIVASDCDICGQAYRCCAVVEADRPGCSFSAETCSSMVGDARPAYVNACLTYVVSVRGAWSGNPPAECR